MEIRSKKVLRGPNLPIGIYYPCAIKIGEDSSFIIGSVEIGNEFVGHNIGLETSNETLAAYLYDQSNEMWTHLGSNFPCHYEYSKNNKFTCAYLKQENAIITGIDRCIASLNLTSKKWTHFTMPFKDGIIFNINENQDSVFYIGSNNTNGSDVYVVSSYFSGQFPNHFPIADAKC